MAASQKNCFSWIFLLGIAIGCMTSETIKPLLIPKAHSAVKERWEYFCIDENSERDKKSPFYRKRGFSAEDINGWRNRVLQKLGREGWGLVSHLPSVQNAANQEVKSEAFCLERPASP